MRIRKRISALIKLYLLLFCFHKSDAQVVWENVGCGVGKFGSSDVVNALVVDTVRNYLYAGGVFDSAGCKASSGLARWNIDHWESLDFGSIKCLCMFHNNIAIGFDGGGVGIYDSTSKIIGGFNTNGAVYSLAVYHNKLYAGGDFTNCGGIPAKKIACYDGTYLTAVGGGISWSIAPAGVWALGVWNDKLYAGGAFDHAGSVTANFIASWNDTAWAPLGSGTYRSSGGSPNAGYVYAIGNYKNNLYIGGEFDSAGGVYVRNFARWDGTNWYSAGGGAGGLGVYCMVEKDSSLYVGGEFTKAGNVANTHYLARFDGTNWHSVDNGKLQGEIYALAVYDSVLYAGGFITYIDTAKAKNIARLVKDVGVGVTPSAIVRPQFAIFPNPVTDKLEISNYKSATGGEIVVTDLLGQTLLRTTQDAVRITELDVSSLPPGMYLLNMRTKNGWIINKFIKQ